MFCRTFGAWHYRFRKFQASWLGIHVGRLAPKRLIFFFRIWDSEKDLFFSFGWIHIETFIETFRFVDLMSHRRCCNHCLPTFLNLKPGTGKSG